MSAEAEPPTRVDEAPAQRVRERRWLPAIIVTASVLALIGGGRLVQGTAPASAPVTVGDVRVQPLPGWTLDQRQDGAARLRRGAAVLDIYAAPTSYTGAAGVAASYIQQVLRPDMRQLTTTEPSATTVAGGIPAVRVNYVGVTPDGVAIEGVVFAASGPRSAVVFDAAAPKGTLAAVAADVSGMIDQAVFAR
jgi:hypothetical protein